jgi:hypothetical protein
MEVRSRKHCTDKIIFKHEQLCHSLQELWEMIKRPNIRIHGVKERAEKTIHEIRVESFPNIGNIHIHVQKSF